MPRPLVLAAAPAFAALGLAALPAVGSASTITPSAACYSTLFQSGHLSYQPMQGTITGGTPGGTFQIYGVGGKASDQTGTFDATGSAPYSISSYSSPGINPSAGRSVKLEVKEFAAGASPVTGSTSLKISTISIDVALKPRSPRSKRVVRISGTPFAGQKLHGFIVRGKHGKKVLKKFSLGTANACGYARTRAVVAPSNYRTGSYYLYINAGKKLDKNKALGSGFRISRSAF